MTKNNKILLGLGAAGLLLFLFLVTKRGGFAGIVTNNPAANPLPQVAPYTPAPSVFNFPGGSYIPMGLGNNCGCSLPGTNNATSNLLPAAPSAFTDLVARSGVDPSALDYTIIAASQQTDFLPQTSSLLNMQLYAGPDAVPL